MINQLQATTLITMLYWLVFESAHQSARVTDIRPQTTRLCCLAPSPLDHKLGYRQQPLPLSRAINLPSSFIIILSHNPLYNPHRNR